jgi:threonine dehydrogenase-like Zn-dependent dehydrogenase
MALVLSDSGELTTRRVATAAPSEGELLLEPVMAGLCGTDLQIMRGVRPDKATILGHEGVARVLKSGEGVESSIDGQIVVFNPVDATNRNDVLGHNTQGIFQQRFLVTRAALEHGLVVPFDSRLPLVYGPLIEPLGTVIYGHRLVHQVHFPKSVAIIGAGPIGLLHALYARTQNCQSIFLVHNSKERLEWAVKRGLVKPEEALVDSPELADTMLDRTGGRGIEAIFLCTTRPNALDALSRSLRFLCDAGCIDLVVGFPDGKTIPELPYVELNALRRANHCGMPEEGVVRRCRTISGKEVWLTGHRGTSTQHLQEAMNLLHEHGQLFASIVSHIISLEAAPLIIEQLRPDRPRQFQGKEVVKIIIDFTLEGRQIRSPDFSEWQAR